jgi:hypothetical protein
VEIADMHWANIRLALADIRESRTQTAAQAGTVRFFSLYQHQSTLSLSLADAQMQGYRRGYDETAVYQS